MDPAYLYLVAFLVIAEMMLSEMAHVSINSEMRATTEDESVQLPDKKMRLFDKYGAAASDVSLSHATPTAQSEFRRYVEVCETGCATQLSCLEFRAQQSITLPRLHEIAVQSLAVPASSAPVERVFSSGRMFMWPQRARMSNKMLTDLIFLKCNANKL